MVMIGVGVGTTGVVVLWAGLSLLLTGRVFSPLGFVRRGGRSRAHYEAEHTLGEFSCELEGTRQKFNILGSYINEYFNTFQAAGWDELRVLLDDLQLIEDSLKVLLENGRYKDVKDISDYLLGRLHQDAIVSLVQRYDGLEPLRNWRKTARTVLLRVVRASIDSAQRTADVGINRKRTTKPTLVTLAELRKVLGDSCF